MALIIYPTTGYDSFCSLADAETLIVANIPSAQRTSWDAITVDADKEILLRQATLLIKQSVTLPSTLEDDLKLATAYLANHSAGINMLNEDNKSNIKRKSIDGVVETEFFTRGEDSNSFPDIVNSLLAQYDGTTDGSFTFNRA